MKILYLSHHSVLEFYEVSLFLEMGHDVFSAGAYSDPKGHKLLHRPGIEGAPYYPEYERICREHPKTELPQDFIDEFELIICMHNPDVLIENWPRMKHKKVIFRSIGQNTPELERILKPLKDEGLKVVRYSPMEKNIPDYMGEDAMIRFYVDKEEFKDWNGNNKRVINFTQSLKDRGNNCYYNTILETMSGYDSKIFGPGNENLGNLNGGSVPFELQKGQLRDSRVFFYAGTWPAPYTLSFIEALMTGTPVVSISGQLSKIPSVPEWDFHEISSIINNGTSGFIAQTINEARGYIRQLLDNDDLSVKISEGGRKKAIELFGKGFIKSEWDNFFKKL